MPLSKDAASVTLERNGKRPVRALSVDIDDPLNDEH